MKKADNPGKTTGLRLYLFYTTSPIAKKIKNNVDAAFKPFIIKMTICWLIVGISNS